MKTPPYVFTQLIQWLPKDFFDRLVKKFSANTYIKGYTCWNHLLVMIWAQLTSRRSLRDIETTLRAHSDKTYRMGIGNHISRNNISHANATRDVALYRELAQDMMRRATKTRIRDQILQSIGKVFSINGFFAIDSTTISLDLKRFPWSVPQREWGGVKIHTMYDLLRKVPRMCLVTGHEQKDQTFMQDYRFEPGCLYVMDKAYCKTAGLWKVNQSGAFFLIRIKQNMVYEVQEEFPVNGNVILADQMIAFTSRWASKGYPEKLRLVTYYSHEKNQTFKFLTNNMEIEAASLGLLYLFRWEIEQFFKWIKQHLRIINFYGYSENAVILQIYTAYTAYCLLAVAADAMDFQGSLYDFANMISTCLTEKEWLDVIVRRHKGGENVALSTETPSLFENYDYL